MCFAARSVRPHADSTLSASMKRACALPVFSRAFEYDPCGTDISLTKESAGARSCGFGKHIGLAPTGMGMSSATEVCGPSL